MYLMIELSMIIPILLIFLNMFFFKKFYMSREKPSPFECGFDPNILPRNPMSMKFYLISIIFLVFDIEIALILPIPILVKLENLLLLNYMLLYFMIILLMGLFYEWKSGGLTWMS